jgi:Ser/Thr protein kinase RdoA (MazF antagonist)
MSAELDTNGWLGKHQNSLCHLDLAPRNILVDHASNAALSRISGILDWDSAVFGPSFMSCAPPLWIWAWNDDEEDERMVHYAIHDIRSNEDVVEANAMLQEWVAIRQSQLKA